MRKTLLMVLLMGWVGSVWANPLLKEQYWERQEKPAAETAPSSCKALPAAEGTRLGIIRQMLDSGRPHAAIAHLDASRIEAPQSYLLRADGLRQTGRGEEAASLYHKLLTTCVAGNAYQGLGLLATHEGNVREAILQLHAASEALPIDPNIRNDYGYALLLAEEHEGALHEFLTAVELAPAHRQASHNLLLLLYRTGQAEKAGKLAEQFGISVADLERLKQHALPSPSDSALKDDVKSADITTNAVSDTTATAYLKEEELQR